MAIKELFNDVRPQILFDPRASQRIDPRFKFTRDGVASYYDRDGVLRYAPANQPRVGFSYAPDSDGIMQQTALLLEKTSTNLIYKSDLSNWDTIPTRALVTGLSGTFESAYSFTSVGNYPEAGRIIPASPGQSNASGFTFSIYVKIQTYVSGTPSIAFRSGTEGSQAFFAPTTEAMYVTGTIWSNLRYEKLPNGWFRFIAKYNGTSIGLRIYLSDTTEFDQMAAGTVVLLAGAQLEAGNTVSSYIPALGSATVTREPDLLSVESTLPITGSIYIDARSLTSDVDTTLLSAAPASPSTDKLALAIRQPASLYNSKALVYEVGGQFKPTLPFPVPSVVQERNLITYGANNYHYRSDSARYTPSSSDDVPANMTRLGIGHDVTDPTKAMTGYINAVYLWPGEITPTVAEALVRGDVDPKNADAGTFTPEAGALAFAFNTQGTATDGDTVVQLPLRGSTNNILVDWGDNTSSSLIGAAASVTVNHTYPSAGIYPVQIEADDDGTNSGLENLQFYNNSPADLVRVLQWGGSTTFNPTTMYRIFRDCTQMDFESGARTNLPDTSAITDWREAFYNCSSLSGQFPNFNLSGATQITRAWYNCSSITTFGSSIDELAPTNTDFSETWYNCNKLTSFPEITIPTSSGAVNFYRTWRDCTGLTSFPAGLNTSAVTNFRETWYNCDKITSFTGLNTSAGTDFNNAWYNCAALTTFTLTNFTSATTLQNAFAFWSAYTGTFPALTTSSALTDVTLAWNNNKMTVFLPPSNTSQVSNFTSAWNGCSGLTSFPLIDTSAATNLTRAWEGCSNLNGTFPSIDTGNVVSLLRAWSSCSNLDAMPSSLDTSKVTNFSRAWDACASLTSFPLYDFSAVTATYATNTETGLRSAWEACTSLSVFPANAFDACQSTQYYNAFHNCALTAQSIENILVSINTAAATYNLNNGRVSVNNGTNAAKSTWSTTANTAYDALVARGWIVDHNP